jgi:uncharacterized protein (DUF433 family)
VHLMTTKTPSTVDLSKYIEQRFFGGGSHIRGRRVPVATIAHSACSQGRSVGELAYQFSVTEVEVLSALLYYEENRDTLEAQENAYQAELDEAYRLSGSEEFRKR